MTPTCFFTPGGRQVTAVTAAEMRIVDRIAVEETGPDLLQMMENAGRNLAELALEILGASWRRAHIVVLAGTGGNGGGGICAARHLANRGARVTLCRGDPGGLRDVPARQLHVFRATAGEEAAPGDLAARTFDLVLDALLGYGLKAAPRGVPLALIRWAQQQTAPVLALDVPSGVDATTGVTPGLFIAPRWTMTLALPKTGLRKERVGDLILADLGIPAGTYRRAGVAYQNPFSAGFRVPLVLG